MTVRPFLFEKKLGVVLTCFFALFTLLFAWGILADGFDNETSPRMEIGGFALFLTMTFVGMFIYYRAAVAYLEIDSTSIFYQGAFFSKRIEVDSIRSLHWDSQIEGVTVLSDRGRMLIRLRSLEGDDFYKAVQIIREMVPEASQRFWEDFAGMASVARGSHETLKGVAVSLPSKIVAVKPVSVEESDEAVPVLKPLVRAKLKPEKLKQIKQYPHEDNKGAGLACAVIFGMFLLVTIYYSIANPGNLDSQSSLLFLGFLGSTFGGLMLLGLWFYLHSKRVFHRVSARGIIYRKTFSFVLIRPESIIEIRWKRDQQLVEVRTSTEKVRINLATLTRPERDFLLPLLAKWRPAD